MSENECPKCKAYGFGNSQKGFITVKMQVRDEKTQKLEIKNRDLPVLIKQCSSPNCAYIEFYNSEIRPFKM